MSTRSEVAKLREYSVVGRRRPTAKDPKPRVFRMRLFAPNHVVAKSRYWYFLSRFFKTKKTTGEILSVNRIYDSSPSKVKTFSVFLRYDSRSGTHNMVKEFRDVTREGAINQLYTEMAGMHRVRFRSLQVIDVRRIRTSQARRDRTKQFLNSKIRFPQLSHPYRPASRQNRSTFVANRPNTFY